MKIDKIKAYKVKDKLFETLDAANDYLNKKRFYEWYNDINNSHKMYDPDTEDDMESYVVYDWVYANCDELLDILTDMSKTNEKV